MQVLRMQEVQGNRLQEKEGKAMPQAKVQEKQVPQLW